MNNIGYVLLFLISVFVSSCSQIALKKSANQKHENKIREIVNPLVLGAYACFFGASLLTVLAYRGVDLSWGPVLETTSYVYIMILSVVFLKEKVSKKKVFGNIIIIIGIVIYAFGDKITWF